MSNEASSSGPGQVGPIATNYYTQTRGPRAQVNYKFLLLEWNEVASTQQPVKENVPQLDREIVRPWVPLQFADEWVSALSLLDPLPMISMAMAQSSDKPDEVVEASFTRVERRGELDKNFVTLPLSVVSIGSDLFSYGLFVSAVLAASVTAVTHASRINQLAAKNTAFVITSHKPQDGDGEAIFASGLLVLNH